MTTGDDDDIDNNDAVAELPVDVEALIILDKKIDTCEAGAIVARWEFGKHLLDARGERQRLPKGTLDALSEITGKGRRELQYRMTLAEKIPAREDLENMCNTLHLSWHELIRQILTDKDHPEPQGHTADRPGKTVDGYTFLVGKSLVDAVKELDRKEFSVKNVDTLDIDTCVAVQRAMKRYSDRIQRRISQLQKGL